MMFKNAWRPNASNPGKMVLKKNPLATGFPSHYSPGEGEDIPHGPII